MPNLTIKNLPDDIYRRLKDTAEANHRSLNGQVIAFLEQALLQTRPPVQEQLRRIRKLRASVRRTFDADEVLEAIEHGRRR